MQKNKGLKHRLTVMKPYYCVSTVCSYNSIISNIHFIYSIENFSEHQQDLWNNQIYWNVLNSSWPYNFQL